MFGLSEIGYEERLITENITALSVEADEALVEYLQMFYGIPRFSRALIQSKAVEFATHTAPGLQDILHIGKIKEAERRRRGGEFVYDFIVLDAPPTGRLPRFLDAPRAIVDLVSSGPIRAQAQSVLDMVTDPERTQVVLVAQPENMPVRETLESIETLHKMNVAIGPLIVNGMWPAIEGLGKDPEATLAAEAEAAGIELSDVAIEQVAIVASAQARRARNQRKALRELTKESGLPHVELPYLFAPRIAQPQLSHLASVMEASGSL
jgi:anion-transporting  ArsA/GET3 family ATPase